MVEAPNPTGPTDRIRPKTYSVAIYVVLTLMLLQGLAFFSIFWLRRQVGGPDGKPLAQSAAPVPEPVPMPDAVTTPAVPETPPEIKPLPGPARLNVGEIPSLPEKLRTLNEEARRFIKNGDMTLAKSAIAEAENLDANHPQTLATRALMMEALGRKAEALSLWEKVRALGTGQSPELSMAEEAIPRVQAEIAARERAVQTPPAPVKANVLHVEGVDRRILHDDSTRHEFEMRITLSQADPTRPVDPGLVGIKFYFYDRLPSKEIVPTSARLQVGFENPRPSWSQGGTEVLRAVYSLDKINSGREFYGYFLLITYRNEVQEERADPATLAELFQHNPQPSR